MGITVVLVSRMGSSGRGGRGHCGRRSPVRHTNGPGRGEGGSGITADCRREMRRLGEHQGRESLEAQTDLPGRSRPTVDKTGRRETISKKGISLGEGGKKEKGLFRKRGETRRDNDEAVGGQLGI